MEYLCLYDGGCLVVLYTMFDYCDYDNTNFYNTTDLQMSHRIPHYPSFIQLLLYQLKQKHYPESHMSQDTWSSISVESSHVYYRGYRYYYRLHIPCKNSHKAKVKCCL